MAERAVPRPALRGEGGRRTGEVPHVAEQQVPAGHAPTAEEDRPDQGVAQEARLGPRLLRVGREPPAAPPAARAWAGRSAELLGWGGWGGGFGAHSLSSTSPHRLIHSCLVAFLGAAGLGLGLGLARRGRDGIAEPAAAPSPSSLIHLRGRASGLHVQQIKCYYLSLESIYNENFLTCPTNHTAREVEIPRYLEVRVL